MELLENKFTIQEALKHLLSKDKARLNNGRELADDLKQYVAPEHAMQLARYRDALIQTNIGGCLMAADKLDENARNQAKNDAVLILKKKLYLNEERAQDVVETLTKAMRWNEELPPPPPKATRLLQPATDKTSVDYYNDGVAYADKQKYSEAIEMDYELINPPLKESPTLSISTFSQNGNIYTAFVNYNGDGKLTTTIGTIKNKKILSVESIDGNFNGEIKALEGKKYSATSITFSHQQKETSTIPEPKEIPKLGIGTFSKNGNVYTAFVNYNGDGKLTTTIGSLNDLTLTVTSTDGNFNGIIKAWEGKNYTETVCSFKHQETTWKIWAVAVVAVIVAFSMLNNVVSNEKELSSIQEQIQENEGKLEKYKSFLRYYGYVSEHFYAERAVLFVNRNSETKLSIYCDLQDSKLSVDDREARELVTADFKNPNLDEDNKATVIIKAGNDAGYSTLKFYSNVNDDFLSVLVVVQ